MVCRWIHCMVHRTNGEECRGRRKRMKKFKVMAVFILFLFFSSVLPMQAAAQTQISGLSEGGRVVFLLDGSNSMSKERWQEALDCVLMVDAMLPSDYQAALAVYNTEVDVAVGFDDSMEEGISGLRNRKQGGYTDPGAALDAALEMLAGERVNKKYVVFITDGEVSLPGEEDTKEAFTAYQASAANTAEQGIVVDVLLYETKNIEDQVSEGAVLTGGSCFLRTQEKTAEDFGKDYLFERIGLEKIMLGVSDSPDNLTKISLQDTFAERVRILLLSEKGLQDIQVSCQSRKISIAQGNRFAVITLEHPLEDTVDLQYAMAEKGRMNAYLVKEYDLTVSAEASYMPETGCQQIQVRVINSEGKDILEDPEIRDAVAIYIEGEKAPYEVSNGSAVITRFEESSREIDINVDFEGLNSRVYCDSAQSSLWLEVPPVELPEEPVEDEAPYYWIYVVTAGVCAAFAVLLCLLVYSKKKTKISVAGKKIPRTITRY